MLVTAPYPVVTLPWLQWLTHLQPVRYPCHLFKYFQASPDLSESWGRKGCLCQHDLQEATLSVLVVFVQDQDGYDEQNGQQDGQDDQGYEQGQGQSNQGQGQGYGSEGGKPNQGQQRQGQENSGRNQQNAPRSSGSSTGASPNTRDSAKDFQGQSGPGSNQSRPNQANNARQERTAETQPTSI